jgi:23S rRNA G2445 N2-methylase RlmL
MNVEEALHLLALVSDTYGDDAAFRYPLCGSPTVCVVRICRDDEDFWLWGFADWRQYRRAEKAATRKLALEKAKAKTRRKQLQEVLV